jgi:GDP-4-dehydro-6-deoxy-D-mannose reductase
MKKILITGAGGFVGTHLIKALQAKGDAEIFAAVYKSTSDISGLMGSDHIIAGDLTDFAFAQKLIENTKPDVIYHLAALSVVQNSVKQATAIMNANTTLQYNLLEAVRLSAPNARVIAVCSANEYGLVKESDLPIKESVPFRPLNPYAISKINQEMLALEYHLAHKLDVVILRPFNHTGEGQTDEFVVPSLAKQFVQIERGTQQEIVVGNLETTRDFTDVLDIAEAYILAAEKGKSGEIYNVGSGQGYTIRQILDLFQKLIGKPVAIKEDQDKVRESDISVLIADASKFKSATGWMPSIPFEETLKRILEYWRSHT